MTELEILAIEEVAIRYEMSLVTKIAIITILSTAFIVGSCCWYWCRDFEWFMLAIIIGAVLGLFIGSCVHDCTKEPVEYETRYKVLISDDIKFNDFNARYEVISQEGEIFTIREREAE